MKNIHAHRFEITKLIISVISERLSNIKLHFLSKIYRCLTLRSKQLFWQQ